MVCNPDNGTVLISSSTEGGVATYFCDNGYELEGNTSRECLLDGQWSGNGAVCKGAVHWLVSVIRIDPLYNIQLTVIL